MPNELQTVDSPFMTPELAEAILVRKNCIDLNAKQRLSVMTWLCDKWQVNMAATPFIWIMLPSNRDNPKGILMPYPTKGFAEQMRARNRISCKVDKKYIKDGMFVVEGHGTDATGRSEPELGAVRYGGDNRERAIALMKGMTVFKRRTALAMSGCGMNAAEEMLEVQGARQLMIDPNTGEILDETPKAAQAPQKDDAGDAAIQWEKGEEERGRKIGQRVAAEHGASAAGAARSGTSAERADELINGLRNAAERGQAVFNEYREQYGTDFNRLTPADRNRVAKVRDELAEQLFRNGSDDLPY